uniref:Uncharacterized protein n=1 Tax=viral metagenome TaxID=1070528 RepID=A0A6M3LM81_9ZZZZ
MGFNSGPNEVRIVGGPISFYEKYQCTNLYVERSFGGGANSLTITNDSTTDTVFVSFDGAIIEAELYASESITLNVAGRNSLYVCGIAGGDNVRIWAW